MNAAAAAARELGKPREPHIGETLAMREEDFGIEGITPEDRAYHGSRFCEVRDAVFANPHQKVWGRPGEPPLPHYKAKESNLLKGILPFGQPYLFGQASSARSILMPICALIDKRGSLRQVYEIAARRRVLR